MVTQASPVGLWRQLRLLIVGAPRDPLEPETRHRMALVAFLAWIGLGADGLSSANYGPEEAFLALGEHVHLALYLAAATAVTVFIISLAYNQVIELFPSGGGGYKVATRLVGSRAGMVSGSALIVDYVLTIAISVASGCDAGFSLLPISFQSYKLSAEFLITIGLIVLNLRGAKEPVAVLAPIFLGFLLTHGFLIWYGIAAHAENLPTLIPLTIEETRQFSMDVGWVMVAALLLRAFALGGGTYTGIEAVSNNVNILREPRIRTGRLTMLYMAASLATTAGGLIVLYLLWNIAPVDGQTLNAVVFGKILANLFGEGLVQTVLLAMVMTFAAALLFVAANTGFLGGPAVLANMAADRWMPHQFTQFSSRLVTQNGVLLMGVAALIVLFVTGGDVDLLVVLYSINVFVTFTLSLFGLCLYWVRHWREPKAIRRFLLAALGCIITGGVLCATIVIKFFEGAWMTLLFTGLVMTFCILTKRHYEQTRVLLARADALFATATPRAPAGPVPPLAPSAQTAVFLVGSHLGLGMHTLLSALKMFPNQFKNLIFVSVGEIDSESFESDVRIAEMTKDIDANLNRYVAYAERHGIPAKSYRAFGADTVYELDKLMKQVLNDFPNSVVFSSKLFFERDSLFSRMLHNQTALDMQRRLHIRGIPMVILPMRV